MAFYKRLFILLIFTTTFTAATAQKKIKEKKVTEIDGVICFKRNSKPVTGIVYSKYESGIEKYHYYVKDGKKNGIEIYFRENGDSKIKRNYKEGLLDGLAVNWLKDGGIEQQYYKDGKKDSLFAKWDKDEKLIETRNYKDDKLDGLSVKILDDQTKNSVIEWVKKENIYSQTDFENLYESKYGHLKRWKSLRNWIYLTNDRIYIIERIEENYKNGLLDGSSTIWFLNAGQVQQIYINGLANGQYARFGKNGKSIETGYYKNGQKNGEFTLMNTLGNVLYRRVFSNDLPNFVLEEEVEFDDGICYYILPNKEKKVFSGILRKYGRKTLYNEKGDEQEHVYLSWEKTFIDGQARLYKSYYDNKKDRGPEYAYGTLSERYYIKDGVKDGLYESWEDAFPPNKHWPSHQKKLLKWNRDDSAFLPTVRCYYKNGELDSIYMSWNDLGNLTDRINYKNGQYHGLFERWHYKGEKSSEYHYVNGEKQGLQKDWWDNGNLQHEYTVGDDKKDWIDRYWHRNGQIDKEYIWKNGKLEGLQREWYDNGQLKKTVEIKNGEKNGYVKTWREDGTRSTSNFYINGQRQFDREINYDRDGNPKR